MKKFLCAQSQGFNLFSYFSSSFNPCNNLFRFHILIMNRISVHRVGKWKMPEGGCPCLPSDTCVRPRSWAPEHNVHNIHTRRKRGGLLHAYHYCCCYCRQCRVPLRSTALLLRVYIYEFNNICVMYTYIYTCILCVMYIHADS